MIGVYSIYFSPLQKSAEVLLDVNTSLQFKDKIGLVNGKCSYCMRLIIIIGTVFTKLSNADPRTRTMLQLRRRSLTGAVASY